MRPQAELFRFALGPAGYALDHQGARAPGRGVYVCSSACAERTRKNKRYPRFAETARQALADGASLGDGASLPTGGEADADAEPMRAPGLRV